MADQNTDPKSKNTPNPNREIIKSLGNLSKDIFRALASASGLKNDPAAKDVREESTANLSTFNTVLTSSLQPILENLGKLSADKVVQESTKDGITAMGKTLKVIPNLLETVNYIINGRPASSDKPATPGLGDLSTSDDFKIDLSPINTLLNAAKGIQLDEGTKKYFVVEKKETPDGPKLHKWKEIDPKDPTNLVDKMEYRPAPKVKSDFDQVLGNYTAVIKKAETIKNLIATYNTSMDQILGVTISEDSKKIVDTLFGSDGGLLTTITSQLRGVSENFTFDQNIANFFIDEKFDKKESESYEQYDEVQFDDNGVKIENDKIKTEKTYRLKVGKSPFSITISKIQQSIASLKKGSLPIKPFVDIFAIYKDGKLEKSTTDVVDGWRTSVKGASDAIEVVFGKDGQGGSIGTIQSTLKTVTGFKFDENLKYFLDEEAKDDDGNAIINAKTGKPEKVKSEFSKNITNLINATKSLGITKGAIAAFVGTFATVEKKDEKGNITQAAKSSTDQVLEWDDQVVSMHENIDLVFGEKGILNKIQQSLQLIRQNNSEFPNDLFEYFVKAETIKDANGEDKKGKTPFGKLIANYVVAIKAVGGITKIATEVNNVGKNIQESFSGEFGKNLGIIKSFAKGDRLALVVTMLGEIKAAMDAGWKDAEQKLGNKSSWKDSKGQSIADGAKAVSPWGENIANLTKMIKSIGDIAKIPKQAATTKAALDKADFKDLKANMSSISGRVSEMMTELDGSFQAICDEIMKTDLPKIAKESVDAITNFNALLQNITNLIENIAKSGETLDNISYRQLVHASVKIDFFMDILVDLIDDLKESSQTLTDRASEINDLNKRITASIQPILNIFNMIEQMTEAIVKQGPLSERRTKKKIKTAGRNVQTMMIWVVDEFENLAAEIQKEMPSEKEKQRTFDEIMEPIKNLIEVMKLIMETKIPFVAKFKLKIWLLRNRIRYIAEQMEDLNKQLESIHKPSSNNVVKEVQQSIMQVQMIMESFNTISGVSLKILMKAWAIKPALEMIVKTLDAFDGLIKRIDELKDPKEANNKLAKFQEVIKGVMMLALSCLLLIPILAVFIVVSPILVAGLLLFAGAMWLITKIVDWTIGAKTGLMLGELGLVILALIGIAMIMLVLALFAEPLVKGFPMIMLFFLGLVGFVLLLAAFGLVVSLAWPLMLVAIAGIAIIALSVVAILIIALCLKALETIDLDTEKIKTNVQLVLSTAIEVMNLAFSPVSDPRGPQQDVGFLEVIGGTVVNIIRALAACIILVFTMISVVAILIIAVMLRMLAWIDVVELEKGVTNAKKVLGFAAEIVDTLFAKPKKDKEESKDGSLWSDLLTYVFEPLGKILKAIFAVAYLAVMIVAVALIALLVMQLRIIAMFDPTMLEQGKSNAVLAVQTALEIVNMLFQPDDADKTESSRTGLLCVVGWVFGQEVENIIRAVFAIAYVGLLLISMVLISALVKQMEEIGKINTETLNKAKTNAQSVVKTSVEIMQSLFEKDDTEGDEGKSWLRKVLEWVLPDKLVMMIDAIIKIGMLALMIVGVGAIAKLAEMLNQVAAFSVTPDQAKAKARQIIGAATSLFSNLKSMSAESNFEAKDADNMMDLCDTLALFPTKITPIGDNILKLLKYSEEEVNQATANCQNIINSIYKVLSDLDKMVLDDARVDKRLDLIDRLSDSIAGFTHVTDKDVKNTQDITDNYIKFLKQVDGMDLKKLQHTDWLMRSWASISRDLQGNFEGLARTINQHVMPVLDTLNKTMDEVKECQRQIIEDLTKPVDINGTGGASSITPPAEQSGINPGTDAPGVDAQGKLDNSVAGDGKVGSDQRRTTVPPKNNGTYSDPIGQQVNPSGKVWKLTLPAGNYLLKKT